MLASSLLVLAQALSLAAEPELATTEAPSVDAPAIESLGSLECHFLFYKLSKSEPKIAELARISPEYRSARDEFERRDKFQAVKPILDETAARVAGARRFHIRMGSTLGEYDFDRKAFPSGMTVGTFVSFPEWETSIPGPACSILFVAPENFASVPMAEEAARSLSAKLRERFTREVSLEIDFEPTGAGTRALSGVLHRAITARIVRVRVFALNEQIGELMPPVNEASASAKAAQAASSVKESQPAAKKAPLPKGK